MGKRLPVLVRHGKIFFISCNIPQDPVHKTSEVLKLSLCRQFAGFVTHSTVRHSVHIQKLIDTHAKEAADKWFKCKLVFIMLDEKSGAEKKSSTQVLVQAADLRDAVKKLDEGMKGTMADYEIALVSETPIMDVYPFHAEEQEK